MNRGKLYIIATVVGVLIVSGLSLWHIFRTLPNSDKAINVHAIDGYEAEALAAMENWNGWVGCKIFVREGGGAHTVTVMTDYGAPCGDPWRPVEEWDHAATAYKCDSKTSQIFVSKPGHANTQACIIHHELGHILGRQHHRIGAMSNCLNPNDRQQNRLRVRDSDIYALRAEYCDL